MEKPLVSIGIPTYNRASGLEHTLKCLTGQSYDNLELIVSDNCSSDDTQQVVASFAKNDKRIKYFRQSENTGQHRNLRFVLEHSQSEYFMWAADDDSWEPEFVEECMRYLLNDKSVVLSFTRIQEMNFTTGRVVKNNYKDRADSSSSNRLIRSIKFLYFSAGAKYFYGIYRKKFINNWIFTTMFGHDHIFLLSLVYHGKIHISDKMLFRMGMDGDTFKRERWHRFCGTRFKKVLVNISSTLTWALEFWTYLIKEKKYTNFERSVLFVVVLLRFLHPRYCKRIAGDFYNLLFNWSIWKFQ